MAKKEPIYFWFSRNGRKDGHRHLIFVWPNKPYLSSGGDWRRRDDTGLVGDMKVEEFKERYGFAPKMGTCIKYILTPVDYPAK